MNKRLRKDLKRRINSALLALFSLSAATSTVYAAGDSVTSNFLGSPLLILVVLLVIDAIAVIYHRARK